MGCLFSDCFTQQETYKICLECDSKKKFNQDLMILNVFHYDDGSYRFLFRCSEGHKFYYCCSKQFDNVLEYNKTNTNMNNFKSKSSDTEILNQFEPSAPLAQVEQINLLTCDTVDKIRK